MPVGGGQRRIGPERGPGAQREAAGALGQAGAAAGDVGDDREHRLAGGHEVGEHRDRAAAAAVDDGALAAAQRGGRAGPSGVGCVAVTGAVAASRPRAACEPGRGRRLADDLDRRGRAGAGAAQDQPRLDGAVPLARLEPDGHVAALVAVDLEHLAPGTGAPGAEGDGAGAHAAGLDREAQVLVLPHRPPVAAARAGDEQRPARGCPCRTGRAPPAPRRVSRPSSAPPTTASTRSRRTSRSSVSRSATAASNAARNASRLSAGSARPAAARWPPWRPSTSAQACSAAEQVEAGDRATRPRPGRGVLRVERDQDGRAVVALGDPRGDDPDDARVPVVGAQDVGRPLAELGDLALGLPADPLLDRAALDVGGVELGGDLPRPLGVVVRSSSTPGVGAVQPPGGVDPRPEAEAERGGVERARVDLGDAHQRAQPGRARGAQRPQALAHEPAVLAGQRDDVADRGQGDELGVGGGIAAERLDELGRHARGAEVRARVAADAPDARSARRAARRRRAGCGGR